MVCVEHGDVLQHLSSKADTSTSENLILSYLVVLCFHTLFSLSLVFFPFLRQFMEKQIFRVDILINDTFL